MCCYLVGPATTPGRLTGTGVVPCNPRRGKRGANLMQKGTRAAPCRREALRRTPANVRYPFRRGGYGVPGLGHPS